VFRYFSDFPPFVFFVKVCFISFDRGLEISNESMEATLIVTLENYGNWVKK
jgi:hypothetical protein